MQTDGLGLTDDELVTQAITKGYEWHYPGRIRIADILDGEFGCDWKRIDIIRRKIVHYGIAKYADSDQSDLLISVDGANAIESGNPIGYMKNLREERKATSIINAHNSIIGNNNSGNNVGQDFSLLPHSQPDTNPKINPVQSSTHEVKMSTAQFIFWLGSMFLSGIGVGYMIFNLVSR